MSRKSILFVITYFDCGGIGRSLQNFLNKYDQTKYSIDIFGLVHDGMFYGEFKNCNILSKDIAVDALISRMGTVSGRKKILSLFYKLLRNLFGTSFQDYIFKRAGKRLLKHSRYDAVIAFSEGVPTRFVSFMESTNRIAWVHCDYKNYLNGISSSSEKEIYDKFSHVVCVSDYTRNAFVECYPSLNNKTTFIYNILDTTMMREQAAHIVEPSLDNHFYNIVSIGRIDPVKRFSHIPQLAKIVSTIHPPGKKGIRWYIIGPKGGRLEEYNSLLTNIKEQKVEEMVIITGELSNPYYHIANADLLVNLSVSEACPYVINEAKVLGTPCVCSNFGSAHEFINNRENGVICPIEDMAEQIESVMLDTESTQKYKAALSRFQYDNNSILRQIYNLI